MKHNKKVATWIGLIVGTVSVVACIATIASFVLYEMRYSEECKSDELQFENITNAINEVMLVTKKACSNNGERTKVVETQEATPITKSVQSRLWVATVRVTGVKNRITFEASSCNVGVPRTIGGAKVCRVVAVPPTCQLNIQMSGARNMVIIDERLRGRVSVSGKGTKCGVAWRTISK